MTGQNKKRTCPLTFKQVRQVPRNPLRSLVYSSICVRTSKINYFFGGHIMTKSNRFIKKFNEDLHAEIFSYIETHPIFSTAGSEKFIENVLRSTYFSAQKTLKNEQQNFHEYGSIEYYKKQMQLINAYEKYRVLTLIDWQERYVWRQKKVLTKTLKNIADLEMGRI